MTGYNKEKKNEVHKMKQGRLETDSTYKNKIQKEIYKIIENKPEKLLSIASITYMKAIFLDELKRYIIVSDYGYIMETANGWGYKTLESAEKAAWYIDMRAERAMRRRRNGSSYDIDMEMADCYYGYNQADFY